MSDQIKELTDIPKDFLREGTLFLNRCTKRSSPLLSLLFPLHHHHRVRLFVSPISLSLSPTPSPPHPGPRAPHIPFPLCTTFGRPLPPPFPPPPLSPSSFPSLPFSLVRGSAGLCSLRSSFPSSCTIVRYTTTRRMTERTDAFRCPHTQPTSANS